MDLAKLENHVAIVAKEKELLNDRKVLQVEIEELLVNQKTLERKLRELDAALASVSCMKFMFEHIAGMSTTDDLLQQMKEVRESTERLQSGDLDPVSGLRL